MSTSGSNRTRKSCSTCHDLDRSKIQYWKGGPSRHRMFKRYFQHSDYHSLNVPIRDLKWSASRSCPFCVVAFDVFRWVSRTKGNGSKAAHNATIEICIPFKPGPPVVLTYSWAYPVPRVYDFQLSLPELAQCSPWSTLTVGTQIPKDPRQSFFRAAVWLQRCLSEHRTIDCVPAEPTEKPLMPTRLLFVGSGLHQVRLVECGSNQMNYFALSYCWGGTPHISTTKANCERMLHNISWKSLPKTCRDAIELTRAMGYRWLWIDSLCILQDDRDEFHEETSRMGDIYRNAVLTIAAANASHVGFGIFHERPETRTFRNRLRYGDNSPSHVIVREPSVHSNLFASPRSEEEWPLLKRAWCLQERLMSTRVLHFTAGELAWECCTLAACECGHMDSLATPKLRYDRARLSKMTPDERAQAWDDLALQSYQNRSLTKESDRFPALSSMAHLFQDEALGTYVAGIWSNYALSMLLWEVKAGKKADRYVAPSWSWASVQGRLIRNDRIVHNRDFEASVDHMKNTLSSKDPYGAIKAASLEISTPACDGVLSTSGHHGDAMILFNENVRAFFVSDTKLASGVFGSQVKCAFLRGLKMGSDGKYIEALVLSFASDLKSYQRIGIAHLTKHSLSHLGSIHLDRETLNIL
ncbi:uncharacterized protein HMPREF1541_08566 [Cyphellophora europaea CBS 101466]|uniref:Heterokaryon incompatibility domain-containing protein n=1 Tax=Cyphellophora europaea (strain CBS 101466) TaxID=1220924 RepID=W2RKM8_CYPE1|nr:uncharacterized protein HMPREF1541_08566 [Cyphellophora europaea CBS 101466]ETN36289.1 hypothetical protein HMPREF1541_08566 [Cyphellophora europaea CBS 101466]